MPVQSRVDPVTDCLERNLAALREAQPALAARLEALDVPPSVVPTRGRDGSSTYVIAADDGTRRWFGGSSMPTISAPAIVASWLPCAGSTLLLGVMTGAEPLRLIENLDDHCAVFVFEEELLHLRLAVSLHDWSGAIAAGRLVPLWGDDVGAALLAFFREHPGYEFPTRLMFRPGMDRVCREGIRSAVEAAGGIATSEQSALADGIGDALRRRGPFHLAEHPRVLITTVDARPAVLESAQTLESTGRFMGWTTVTYLPDSPARCHWLGRLRGIEACRADLVLTVNSFPTRLEPYLPEGQPTVGWFLPAAVVPAAMCEGLPRRSLSLAATPLLLRQLRDAGLPDERVHLLETGADAVNFSPLDCDDPALAPYRCDVAVLCDIADVSDPTPYVSLQSHVRLFHAIVQSGPAWSPRYVPSSAPAILTDAEARSDVRVTDESLRDTFVRLIQQIIAPTVVARASVERLARAHLTVRVWGRNWKLPPGSPVVAHGPMPAALERNRIVNAARVVLCPFLTDATPQVVLDTIAAGGRILVIRPETPWEDRHPQLFEVLSAVPAYAMLGELPRAIRALLGGARGTTPRGGSLRDTVLARHTLACRLAALLALARRFWEPAGRPEESEA